MHNFVDNPLDLGQHSAHNVSMNENIQPIAETDTGQSRNHRALEANLYLAAIDGRIECADTYCLCGAYIQVTGDTVLDRQMALHRAYRKHLRSVTQ